MSGRGCNPMSPRLQPYVSQAATLCIPGCNPMSPRLQPCVSQAATLCLTGCNPMYPSLQPYVSSGGRACWVREVPVPTVPPTARVGKAARPSRSATSPEVRRGRVRVKG